jgi:hypothetical protein
MVNAEVRDTIPSAHEKRKFDQQAIPKKQRSMQGEGRDEVED